MLNGNLYGLVITMLTFVITVVLTMRQVEQTGVQVEFTIRPVAAYKEYHPDRRPGSGEAGRQSGKNGRDGTDPQPAGGKAPLAP